MSNKFILAAVALCCAAGTVAAEDLAAYVDTKIGTGGGGNTCPGPVWPLGMVQPGPDTTLVTKPHDHEPSDFSTAVDYRSMCNGYDPKSDILLGFTQTHLSGTGCCDLQDFLLLPFTGEYPATQTNRFVVKMDKASEVTQAGYYAVTLPEFGVRAEITASKRVAYHRYTYAKGGTGRIFVDMQAGCWAWFRCHDQNYPRHRVVYSQSSATTNGVVEAYNRVTVWNNEREIFCRMEFSKKPVKVTEMPRWGKCGRRYVLDFDLKPGESVVVKAAISSVDFEGARANLASDPEGFDFDVRLKDCKAAWNTLLGRATVEGSVYQKKLFYTALYHAYVQPNLFSDVDGRCRFQDLGKYGKVVDAVRPAQKGEIYTTLSTWDTFRAAHPLYTLLTPHYAGEFAESMVAYWRALGKMPKWQMFGGENYCMIGPHSITIVADALMKGLMRTDAKTVERAVEDSLRKYNRRGTEKDVYSKLGYIPCDRSGGTVSSTLEWGVVDYAAAKVAELAGDAKTAKEHYRTSQFYRNLYDKPTGMMRARFTDGSWRTPFDPYKQKPTEEDRKLGIPNDYTEGGAMQYAWHVLHDPAGLAALHGGPAGFAKSLEKLFTDNTQVGADVATGECSGTIGQFALGNEHDQHVPYLWQYANRPDKTAEIVRELCDRYFNDTAEGICGNDDCGQISAWYVFACLGFYPVNPVGGDFVLGAPQMARTTFNLENGSKFTVIAKNLSKENKYVKRMTLNGKPFTDYILKYADFMKGGEFVFEMGSK